MYAIFLDIHYTPFSFSFSSSFRYEHYIPLFCFVDHVCMLFSLLYVLLLSTHVGGIEVMLSLVVCIYLYFWWYWRVMGRWYDE